MIYCWTKSLNLLRKLLYDSFQESKLMCRVFLSGSYNQDVSFKELSSELLSQNAFSAIEDVDLSILTRCLQIQESLDEPDERWEWDKLFTEITAQINADKNANGGVPEMVGIGPDEVPPTAKQD